MTSLPSKLPSNTRVLDISYNNVSIIENYKYNKIYTHIFHFSFWIVRSGHLMALETKHMPIFENFMPIIIKLLL